MEKDKLVSDGGLSDLPRLIELQRTAAPDCPGDDGWNAGLVRAAEMVREMLARSIPNAEGVEAMVEKVAKAILNSARDDGNDSPVDYGDAEGLARAALESVQLSTLLERVERLETALLQLAHAYHAAHITFGADPEQSVALKTAREALVSLNVR